MRRAPLLYRCEALIRARGYWSIKGEAAVAVAIIQGARFWIGIVLQTSLLRLCLRRSLALLPRGVRRVRRGLEVREPLHPASEGPLAGLVAILGHDVSNFESECRERP